MENTKRLYRSRSDKMIGGVCGGIAQYLNLDPSLIRVITVLLAFGFGSGLLAYLIAFLIIPEEPLV